MVVRTRLLPSLVAGNENSLQQMKDSVTSIQLKNKFKEFFKRAHFQRHLIVPPEQQPKQSPRVEAVTRHKATFVNPDTSQDSLVSDYDVGRGVPFREMLQRIHDKRTKILSRA
jgi:hypothetical protein